MERTVPSATSEEIKLYRSTIYSLLRSTTEVQIRTLEEMHTGMNSLLHSGAPLQTPDISAFIYSAMRLPDCIPVIRSVILGQNAEVYHQHGYHQIEQWTPVSARARRRRCFYDGKETLACYIASRSDIEDVIPALTAYQIEWNKMHLLLQQWPAEMPLDAEHDSQQNMDRLSDVLKISPEDLGRLRLIWRDQFFPILNHIRSTRRSIGVRLLSGSLSQYQRATHDWWANIERACPDLHHRPIYFISSNTHSLINTLVSFPLLHQQKIIDYIENSQDQELLTEWQYIRDRQVRSSAENYLYYVSKKYQGSPEGRWMNEAQTADERTHGVIRVPSERSFDVEAQVIELNKLNPQRLDPRLQKGDLSFLRDSDALILNIDYPLGLAAFNILSKVSEQAVDVLGVYVMGKSASLNAARGDIMIPTVVQDEHSHNTYFFGNCFTAASVAPFLTYGTVLDNQKALCVLGTFLQNAQIRDVFFREGYADIEMEAGPFLSAVYEMHRPKRHPIDEIVNLYNLPFDLGVLHYVSDTPLSKGKNLGAGTLSYFGMDSTYAATLAIMQRIIQQERQRLS